MIHHIAIATKDVSALREYYLSLPGLNWERDQVTELGELRSTWFQSGNSRIMIEKEIECKGPYALIFDGSDKSLRKKVELTFGKSFESRTDYTVYFRDPDGNKIGYSSYPDPWN
ncbi:glyoxalase [Leptospira perolatii]|uniref:Glyoxalase n=1 Tax=Leptospira perolatii TaxID=2023191 RepID=A0A2M9ZIK5_9LEPT|nr:glyoxalase [Leptospira perolatii]PJZ68475.1 glyoxalase [Leptospira perolatii]PJZ71897.1 glyoxalase [Leptospira perolatii]